MFLNLTYYVIGLACGTCAGICIHYWYTKRQSRMALLRFIVFRNLYAPEAYDPWKKLLQDVAKAEEN